ncbi:MAG: C-GCAxxG-C-C family (seleno)protein [Calditrichia bacterium]
MEKKVTRKEFFKESAKYAAGLGLGAAGLSALASKKAFAEPTWPWPYAELDVEEVRVLGHDSYYSGGCAYGAFNAIIEALRGAVGAPFTDLPTEIMNYGGGGGAGWGTLCGALNGAAAAISLVSAKADVNKLVSELFGWYTQSLFPSDLSNQYAGDGTFTVNNYTEPLAQNASDSPLCHVSVTEWCNHASLGVGSTERKERCARLTGDVAAYAAKILNDNLAGEFTPLYVPPETVATCMACHGSSGMKSNVAAKMDCEPCHGDPHNSSDIKTPETVTTDFELKQNYPNPFNPETHIQFSLPKSEAVTLTIYSLDGRQIKTLLSQQRYSAGSHQVKWDGKDNLGNRVSSGMYYYRIKAGNYTKVKNMLLVK